MMSTEWVSLWLRLLWLSPACPSAQVLLPAAQSKLRELGFLSTVEQAEMKLREDRNVLLVLTTAFPGHGTVPGKQWALCYV